MVTYGICRKRRNGGMSEHLVVYLHALRRSRRVISLIFYCPTDLRDRILRATCRRALRITLYSGSRGASKFTGRAKMAVGKVGQV